MRKFKIQKHLTKDDCWRMAIANILQVKAKTVPHFLKEYGKNYIIETRKWLNKRGKSMIFVPISSFIGDDGWSDNGAQLYPDGCAIVWLSGVGKDDHVDVVIDGKLHRYNIDHTYPSFDAIKGYYIIYDLYPS